MVALSLMAGLHGHMFPPCLSKYCKFEGIYALDNHAGGVSFSIAGSGTISGVEVDVFGKSGPN